MSFDLGLARIDLHLYTASESTPNVMADRFADRPPRQGAPFLGAPESIATLSTFRIARARTKSWEKANRAETEP